MKEIPIDWEMTKVGERTEKEFVDAFRQQHIDRYWKEKERKAQKTEVESVPPKLSVNAAR
jgi:hypothetical protein